MKKYETIIFDVDDTIRDYTLTDQLILEKTQKSFGIKLTWRLLLVKLIEVMALYARSFGILKANMKTLTLRLEIHAVLLGLKTEEYIEKYYEFAKEINIPFENTKEVLKHLRENNYEVYIASNNPKSLAFCESMDFDPNHVFITEKDSTKAYTFKSLSEIKRLKLSTTLIVGDSLIEDVCSAETLGIDSAWLNYNSRLKKMFSRIFKPTYCINDIIEVINILEE